jgi:hypothetical protein
MIKEVPMRRVLLALAFASAALISITFSPPASAADAGAVITACEKDPHCAYGQAQDGSLVGCSEHSCFVCPIGGGHQCHATKTGGASGRRDVTLSGVKLAPKDGTNVGAVKAGPAYGGGNASIGPVAGPNHPDPASARSQSAVMVHDMGGGPSGGHSGKH